MNWAYCLKLVKKTKATWSLTATDSSGLIIMAETDPNVRCRKKTVWNFKDPTGTIVVAVR